jgi:hypothetical protein
MQSIARSAHVCILIYEWRFLLTSERYGIVQFHRRKAGRFVEKAVHAHELSHSEPHPSFTENKKADTRLLLV